MKAETRNRLLVAVARAVEKNEQEIFTRHQPDPRDEELRLHGELLSTLADLLDRDPAGIVEHVIAALESVNDASGAG